VLAFLVCAMAFVYAFVCALGSDQCSAFSSCLLYFFYYSFLLTAVFYVLCQFSFVYIFNLVTKAFRLFY